MKITIASLAIISLAASAKGNLHHQIDFSTDSSLSPISAGQVIDTEFSGWGVNVSATGGAGFATLYDSTTVGGADDDLEAAFKGGNASGDHFGNLLIVQESGSYTGNFADNAPDDNASGGSITFGFDKAGESFQFSTVDVDHIGGSGFSVTLTDTVNSVSSTVEYAEFLDPSSPFYDSSVAYGDNFANVLPVIDVEDLGMSRFNEVTFEFDGSTSVGSIAWNPDGYSSAVPEPSSALLILIASLFPILRRSRK